MKLRIRAYNVLFGDCLLVSWPEADGLHHAWIDFGNFHNDSNAVFAQVYQDVLTRTNGRLDLLVVTHRHLDHVEGFYTMRKRFADDFQVQRLWHAFVDAQVDGQLELALQDVRRLLPPSALAEGELARILRNNFGDAGLTTDDRMQSFLQELSLPAASVHRVHRDSNPAAIMPPGIANLHIEVLAPERDSRVYLQPLAGGMAAGRGQPSLARKADAFDRVFAAAGGVPGDTAELTSVASFARVRRQLLAAGGLDLLAAVDRTRNNTSIVLKLTVGGRRLLLTGDAEEKSWEVMRAANLDLAADAIKVGHHGSINASPDWSYDAVMPQREQRNAALVSTEPTRFTGENEVPKAEVLSGWRARLKSAARLRRTDRAALGSSVVVELT